MKRLLLTVVAATAIMLTACIDVKLASSAQAADGARITLITSDEQTDSRSGEAEQSGEETRRDIHRGDAADTRK